MMALSITSNRFTLFLALFYLPPGTNSLVTNSIKIVGSGLTSIPQSLPPSYVNTFPRWTINDDGEISPLTISTSSTSLVDPTSDTELWWPSDLSQIQVRPALEFFIKSGYPSHVLAGLEVRVPRSSSADGNVWANFGMNCQPLARQWVDFGVSVEESFRVEVFVGNDQIETELGEEGSTTRGVQWKSLLRDTEDSSACDGEEDVRLLAIENAKLKKAERVTSAIDFLGTLLASMDDTSPFADGMHLVRVPVGNEWVDLPHPGETGYHLASLATSESDARELLNAGDLIEISATSLLNVKVEHISPGSESKYLPDAYKSLYKN
mmetsp:Transcript_5692/g.7120  ORF Transcript_5692/g.7120 Transcript_5692/m.7120 type:complete len:322 (+) Transcript_5692:89-1054(+)